MHTGAVNMRDPHVHHMKSWEILMLESELAMAKQLEAVPLISKAPVRVSLALADSNFLSHWKFVHHFVLPHVQAQAPSNSTAFFYVYRWILAACVHSDVDPSGSLKTVLGEYFDLSSLDCIPTTTLSPREHKTKELGTLVSF